MGKKTPYSPAYPDAWDNKAMHVLALRWKVEVLDKADEVDPNGESLWGDLAMGFALGAGLSPDQAFDFELFVAHMGLR